MTWALSLHTPGELPKVVGWDEPAPGPGEVLVHVTAAPISALDLLCASGTSYFGVPATPYVPGVQGVGTVAGRTVWFSTTAGMRPGNGSMAATVAVAEDDVVPLPEGIDPVLVAALGFSAVAAQMAMTWRGELTEGEQVIVLGAGGVVGQSAVQLARVAGARRVVAAARSANGQARAAKAGADAVVALDTSDVDELAARFASAVDGPADLLLDPLFGVPAAAAARSLRAGGRWVNLGGSAGETSPVTSALLRSKSLRLLGYTNNELTRQQRADAMGVVAARVAEGALTVPHETVTPAEVPAAWADHVAGTRELRTVLVSG
ncbi:zinc-binding alcohol dehydrogenase family protein [Actinophytocola sp.]|uniref:zinc-binding alcohol dehydrogenase family protein n=1 Tax=Actinophytocola sp. TaxID=1872138 RepID=UPI002ED5E60C